MKTKFIALGRENLARERPQAILLLPSHGREVVGKILSGAARPVAERLEEKMAEVRKE